ncbi:hypothetical protein BDZ45DRAFT_345097 [Acephala macrosclerotiorum]|nr:hypothetical protein BDZ45DRAFT_345097 [Acephala macrosclerotiorum]
MDNREAIMRLYSRGYSPSANTFWALDSYFGLFLFYVVFLCSPITSLLQYSSSSFFLSLGLRSSILTAVWLTVLPVDSAKAYLPSSRPVTSNYRPRRPRWAQSPSSLDWTHSFTVFSFVTRKHSDRNEPAELHSHHHHP